MGFDEFYQIGTSEASDQKKGESDSIFFGTHTDSISSCVCRQPEQSILPQIDIGFDAFLNSGLDQLRHKKKNPVHQRVVREQKEGRSLVQGTGEMLSHSMHLFPTKLHAHVCVSRAS